jgi:hypothetical protein
MDFHCSAGDSGDGAICLHRRELVMHLWNWVLLPLLGWRQLTFWQALGLLTLCRILFGGLGSHDSGRPSFRRRMKER